MSAHEAKLRLQAAVAGKSTGLSRRYDARLKTEIQVMALADVVAADVLTLTAELDRTDPVIMALHDGCAAGRPERHVAIQADDLRHLLARWEQRYGPAASGAGLAERQAEDEG